MAVITNHIISSIITISDLNRLTIGIKCVIDSVTLTTGDHEIFAITNNDLVDTIEVGRLRRNRLHQRRARNSRGIEINLTVVTQHHIAEITNTSMNHIHTRTTKNDIGTLADEDQIVATMLRSDRFDEVDNRLTSSCIELDMTVIANDDIVTKVRCRHTNVDLVVTDTSNHIISAITSDDLVDTTQAGSRRSNRLNQRRARNSQGIEINLTVVTQHHIAEITNTSMNHIHTRATKNDIGTLVNEDQIVATMLRSDGFDEVDD